MLHCKKYPLHTADILWRVIHILTETVPLQYEKLAAIRGHTDSFFTVYGFAAISVYVTVNVPLGPDSHWDTQFSRAELLLLGPAGGGGVDTVGRLQSLVDHVLAGPQLLVDRQAKFAEFFRQMLTNQLPQLVLRLLVCTCRHKALDYWARQ